MVWLRVPLPSVTIRGWCRAGGRLVNVPAGPCEIAFPAWFGTLRLRVPTSYRTRTGVVNRARCPLAGITSLAGHHCFETWLTLEVRA